MELIFAFLLFVAIVVFVLSGISAKRYQEQTFDYAPVEYFGLSTIEKEFQRILNEHRVSIGLPPFIVEELASNVCRYQNIEDIALGVPS